MSLITKAAVAGLSSEVDTFSDFAFLLYARVLKISENHDQIHLVFKRYFEGSLKSGIRESRGLGLNFVVDSDTKTPNNFANDFMKNDSKQR